MEGSNEVDGGTIGELLPGMEELPGEPGYPTVAGPICTYLSQRDALTWRGLAELRTAEIAAIPHMGPVRMQRTIEAVGDLLSLDRDELERRLAEAKAGQEHGGMGDLPLGRLLPGIADLDGEPTRDLVGEPVMRFLRGKGETSWSALAEVTVGHLETLPGVGPVRSKQIQSRLSALVGADLNQQKALAVVGADGAKQAIGDLVEEIAAWAVANGHTGSVLGAIQLAADSEAADSPRAELRWLASISAAELAAADRVARYDPAVAATRLLTEFDDRELAILDRIVNIDGSQKKLEEIGKEYKVTRERIRQIEAKVKKRLASAGLEPSYRSISAEADRVRARLGALSPASRLLTPPGTGLHDRSTRLFLYLAGPYALDGDWLVLDGISDRRTLMRTAFADVQENGTAEFTLLVGRLLESGVDPEVAHLLIAAEPRLRVVDDQVLDWSGSLADKAALVLALTSKPMTLDELAAVVEPNSVRSMTTQIQTDPRFMRVGLRRYALAIWDLDQFGGIVPAMAERLADGPLPITDLANELADEYGVSPNSIKIHASTHPGFLSQAGKVALRPALQPYRPKENLEETARCYVLDGCWSWRVPVDHDVLRGAGRSVPEAFAVHLGAAPLSKGAIDSPVGRIALAWDQYPHIGSLRAAARSLDADQGDWMFIRRIRPATVDLTLVRADELADDPELRLRALLGAGGSASSLEQVLADALGLAGTVNHDLADERAVLVARKERMLLDLLDAIDGPEGQR